MVLEFWGTACVPCIEAIPHMNELTEQFSNRPVVFLDISNDNEDYLKNFLKRKPMKGWLALDGPLNPTATAFDVVVIPHMVIVDTNGRIAAITHPEWLTSQHLEEILAGKPSTLPGPETISQRCGSSGCRLQLPARHNRNLNPWTIPSTRRPLWPLPLDSVQLRV